MRQLSLFKGKRQRGVQPPPPLEYQLHCMVADIVKRWIDPSWRYTHLPMGEHRNKATAIRLKRMGVTPGWPDFMFVGPAGIFWLELKRPGMGRLSIEQAGIAAHLVACGHAYLATTSVKDAVAQLVDHGILRGNIEVQ
jgi:hypothetical protein